MKRGVGAFHRPCTLLTSALKGPQAGVLITAFQIRKVCALGGHITGSKVAETSGFALSTSASNLVLPCILFYSSGSVAKTLTCLVCHPELPKAIDTHLYSNPSFPAWSSRIRVKPHSCVEITHQDWIFSREEISLS